MCTVLLPQGGNPIAVKKYINYFGENTEDDQLKPKQSIKYSLMLLLLLLLLSLYKNHKKALVSHNLYFC